MGRRRDFYVYAHRDRAGGIFYVGKGCGLRAWSGDRHEVWHRYVAERLGGHYRVDLLHQHLNEAEADELEAELIAEYGPKLVNWINPGRDCAYDAITRFHQLRAANRARVAAARPLEKADPEKAIGEYKAALATMREYMAITLERGLVADLATGLLPGDHGILDRLTLCLARTGRHAEVVREAEAYFADFPSASDLAAGRKILARAERSRKALEGAVAERGSRVAT